MCINLLKSEQEWRSILTDEQYRVCRLKETEPSFSGKYCNCELPGIYVCACCQNSLFSSEAKFNSGTGWPSFFETYNKDCVETKPDHSHGLIRTEACCRTCGAHLGHVFEDGPKPTGLRYCINSVALSLKTEAKT